MKQRIPFDIEFLVESLTNVPISNAPKLNEDPDGVYGADDSGDTLYWSSGDNVAFICTKQYSIIAPGQTHHDIIHLIRRSYNRADAGFDVLIQDGCYVSDRDDLARDVFDRDGILNNFIIHGEKEKKNFRYDINGLITGRIWRDYRIMSFWNDQQSVVRGWNIVEKMFKDFRDELGGLEEYSVDWVERQDDTEPLTPAGSISSSKKPSSSDTKKSDHENEPEVDDRGQFNFFSKLFRNPILLDKLSDAQLKQIRDKIHILDPQIKAQVMKANHNTIVNKAAEIADKLGMSVAEFHSLWSVDETKLNENPDGVYGGDDSGEKLHWTKGETFFAAKTYNIIGPSNFGSTHYDIVDYAKRASYDGKIDMVPFSENGIDISDAEALLHDILDDNGSLNHYFSNHDPEDEDAGFRTEIPNVLLGRLWTKQKIISFWAEQKVVVKLWPNVKKLFDDNPRLGKLGDYKIDWVERSDHTDPFTPASTLEKSSDAEGTQMNFFTKIFNAPDVLNKMSPEQLKKIRDKVHVMEPEVKAQIMKANHGALINKAGEIADKLGMSVAEFNSLWSMDENTLQESPDSFVMNRKQRAMFAARGFHKPEGLKKISYFDQADAVAFLIDIAGKITIYNPPGMGERLTHPDMGNMVMGYTAHPNDYDKFPVDGYKGFAFDLSQDIEPAPGFDPGPVAVLQANTIVELVKSLKILARNLPLDGDVPRRDTKFIQGRIWLNSNAISFWGTKDHTIKHFDMVNQLLIGLKLNKSKMIYEFTDSGHLYTYDELTGKSVELRSKEEMDRLMAIQHLDPRAKKRLAAMQGNLKQKGDAGWDFQAQKHAAMPALQEIVKQINISK